MLVAGCTLAVELHNGTFIVSLEDGWIMFQVEKHEVSFITAKFFFVLVFRFAIVDRDSICNVTKGTDYLDLSQT